MEELETQTGASELAAGQPPTEEQPAAPQPVSMDELLGAPEAADAAVSLADAQLRAVVEAIVYVAEEPVTPAQIGAALLQPVERVEQAMKWLIEEFDKPEHGVAVREVAGGYKMATKPEHHDAVRAFAKSLKPPLKLSLPALETLAVIAYKQPATAPEIMEIRGVQGTGVLKTLLDRKLIAAAGRKNVIGKPILYKTTKEFLIQFGLKDLSELPSLKEFEEIRRMSFGESEAEAEPAETASAAPLLAVVEPAEAKAEESEPVGAEEDGASDDAGAVEPAVAELASVEPAAAEPEAAVEPAAVETAEAEETALVEAAMSDAAAVETVESEPAAGADVEASAPGVAPPLGDN
jgi:segregation and condensation protein B